MKNSLKLLTLLIIPFIACQDKYNNVETPNKSINSDAYQSTVSSSNFILVGSA